MLTGKTKQGYNNKNIDEMIASASNEQLKELTNYYNASTKTDSEYKKMRKDSIREINKVLNDEDLDLDPKYKKIIAKS